MRQFRLSSSERSENGPAPGFKERLMNNWRLIFVLCTIMLIAFILRVFFAYDVAIASGYAFSGGSGAAYHALVIENIMESWKHVIYDQSLNYPYSELNVNPPLMDWVLAIFAKIVTLFGVSASTAAAGTLVWSTVIFGTLACIPMYYLGRDMFGHKAGVIATLLYAIFAVTISQTVLSNGTEAAFYGFFFLIMLIYLFRAVKAISSESFESKKGESGSYLRSIFAENKVAMKNAVIAGIFMAIVALSWNGFRPVFTMVCAIMIVQAIADRVRKKDPTSSVFMYATVLIVGTVISAPVYAIVGLWSVVYSGVFMIVILSIISAFVISETKRRPWLLVIPILAIIIGIFMLIMWFALPDLFSAMVNGNSLYTDPTYASLVNMNMSTSLSAMAAYYGWLTMWFPYVLICLMVYKLRDQLSTSERSFTFFWMVAMVMIGWSSSMNVYLAAPAYAIGGGAILAMLLDKADIPGYFANFKGSGSGVRTFLKNLFKPLPFGTILTVVLLVGAPNAMYAIDAASSSNTSDSNSGAFGYYVKNNADWNLNDVWDSFSDEDKDGALLTYWDYSAEASLNGGFDSVAGLNGNGAAAASNMMLSKGGSESNVAMAIRLMEYHGLDKFETYLKGDLNFTDDDYDKLAELMDDPASIKKTILANPDAYGKYSASISDENAMYIGVLMFLTGDPGVAYDGRIETLDRNGDGALTELETIGLYEKACELSGKDISYLLVTRGMIPLMYGDGSSFSTLAYMNNYYLDGNGSPTEFYTLNYNGYYTYTNAMYETLLWKTYFGPIPSDMGYSSAVAMMNAFAASDGSDNTRPIPGYGLVNYEVAYWKVLYSEDPEAEEGSDDWVEMDAFTAMARQDDKIAADEEPGLINFMSGLPIVLRYVSCDSADTVTGEVTSSSGGVDTPVEGVRVTLFDDNGIQRMTTFTDSDGKYELIVPFEEGRIEITVGTTSNITGGLKVKEVAFSSTEPLGATVDFDVVPVSFTGQVFYDDTETDPLKGDLKFKIEGTAHGGYDEHSSNDGTFTFIDSTLVPDTYTLTVTDENGDTVCTATYNPVLDSGDIIRVNAYLSTGTLNITINDEYGQPVTTDKAAGTGYVKLTSLDVMVGGGTPYSRVVELEDGKATVNLVPGTYRATLVNADGTIPDPDREVFGNPVSVTSGSSASLTAKLQAFATIQFENTTGNSLSVNVTNGTYTADYNISSSAPNNELDIRVPMGSEITDYTVSATYNDPVTGKTMMFYDSLPLNVGDVESVSPAFFDVAYEYSAIVRSTSGTAVGAYVTFYSEIDGLPVVSTWTSNGEVSVMLPAGDYVIHAYPSSSSLSEAYLEKFSMPASSSRGGQIYLEKAKTLTASALYTDIGSQKIPYFQMVLRESGKDITLNVVTNADGSYSKLVPYGNYSVTIQSVLSDGTEMEGAIKGSTTVTKVPADATSTMTVTFRTLSATEYSGLFTVTDQNGDPLDDGTEIKFKLKASYAVESPFTITGGSIDFGDFKLVIGEYTITIDKADGYYYSGNVTLNVNGDDVTIEAKKVDAITFGKLGEKDKVTITPLDDEEGWFDSDKYDDEAEEQTYYFETGKQFSVMVTGKDADDNKMIWYHFYNLADSTGGAIDVELSPSFDLKGYVGYAGTGILEIKDINGIVTIIDVSSGKYTVELPKIDDWSANNYSFEAKLESYIDETDPLDPKTKYTYTGSGDMTEEMEVFNFIVSGVPQAAADDKKTAEVDSIVWIDAVPGERRLQFKITVTGDEFRSLFMVGGGWDSIKFYSSAPVGGDFNADDEISYLNIENPGDTVDVWVDAVFKDDVALDTGLTIEFKDAASESIFTYTVDASKYDGVTPLELKHELTVGKGENDNFGENDYLFAIVLENKGQVTEKFILTHDDVVSDALKEWYIVFVTSDGKSIYLNDGSAEFTVPGMSTVTVYAKLVNDGADKLPGADGFDVKMELDTMSGIDPENDVVLDKEFGDIARDGAIITLTIVPQTTKLDAGSGNASGPNIFMDAGAMPTYVWAMIALSILLFILILWQGMKRGVFSRRK